MYPLLRYILFWFDAEKVHYFSMNLLSFVCRSSLIRNYLKKKYTPPGPRISKQVFGISFPNPVGLAAGFDKNAKYLPALRALGFGFVEIGTVTPLPQEGNIKPRLFRLPADQALVNRMGFNNDGARAIAERVRKYRQEEGNCRLIIGGNIGKNKTTPNEMAWKDYEICFTELHGLVDYFVVNVSSPNTPGLRDLQQKDSLQKILSHLQQVNRSKNIQKPLLLKISPDLGQKDLDDIIDLAMEIRLDGLVAANTTITRDRLITPEKTIIRLGGGGLSGRPLKEESCRITRYIRDRTRGTIPVISSGGISTARDARDIMVEGASLVQVWTGFIYEGPGIVKKILEA
jgi:dihydroorotate dehydrogenase